MKQNPQRPTTWLVVRSRSLKRVQVALRLHDPKSCPCAEGLSGSQGVFIAPPSGKWILVTGLGLPEPGEDIDLCFRFILRLSRELGTVQYFSANHFQNHHAWVWLRRGRVVRAYAWTGQTAWNQGRETRAERELHLKCLPYFSAAESLRDNEFAARNTDRVAQLAALWGMDPDVFLDELQEPAVGISGEPARWD